MSMAVTEAAGAGEGGGEAGLYFSFLLQKNQKKKKIILGFKMVGFNVFSTWIIP